MKFTATNSGTDAINVTCVANSITGGQYTAASATASASLQISPAQIVIDNSAFTDSTFGSTIEVSFNY